MKEATTLSDMVHIAKTTESMVYSETLSTQYLETVKSTKTIEGVKHDNSKNKNRNRSRSQDIHLNPDKIQIDCEKVPFFGHTLSKDGVHPDKAKVELIQNWPIPENIKELQSFLGTVNYLSKFLAFLSDIHVPLQGLLKKDAEFTWTETHTQAFNQ